MGSKHKVGIVGVGRIGSHCAYTLAMLGLADELVLVDLDEKRAVSEAADLGDCLCHYPRPVRVRADGYAALGNCEIVVITAGIQTTSRDRLSLLGGNAKIVDSIVDQVMCAGFHGIMIMVTNPCDVLAWRALQTSGLGRGRVFATGTALDTARLRGELSRATGVHPAAIQGLVLGEHGSSQVPLWSRVSICGSGLDVLAAREPRFRVDREAIGRRVRDAAWTAVEGKGVAEYGVAACLAGCVRAVFHDEKAVMPLGGELRGGIWSAGRVPGRARDSGRKRH